MLELLLARKFGVLPSDIVARVANAKQGELEHWVDRTLSATTLESVFES
jgi:hypothetical protein